MERDPVFIVSTGRCGSTLLSTMLRRHPRVLSVSEMVYCVRPLGFPAGPVDGRRFWSILADPRPGHTLAIRHRLLAREFLYPLGPGARFDSATGVPPILMVTLPHLAGPGESPDDLFDEVRGFVLDRPEGPVAGHYAALLGWLRDRAGREAWVERSGASLRDLPDLLAHFPAAKFVHLHRDGRETAMSMSRHFPFRFAVLGKFFEMTTGVNPYLTADRPAGFRPPEGLAGLLPESFDRAAFLGHDLPIEAFGGVWSTLVVEGSALLDQLPPSRRLEVRYESLIAAPAPELRRLLDFVGPGLDDAAWLADAASLCVARPPTWTGLPADSRARLEAACAPGLGRLGYA